MEGETSQQPLCQSCGMPLLTLDDFGTDEHGSRTDAYCKFCFQNGAFTDPTITLEKMIGRCAGIMEEKGIMQRGPAAARMKELLPTLRRWKGG